MSTAVDPVDQATRDLVSRDGLHRTMFVEAGAGTGKTTQLVERIASLVLQEGVPLRSIAAITFTEAAAAELQTRIRERFEDDADGPDGEERDRALAALADADLAAISTLHGFASRLLNEFAIEAKLPPRVRVLDEVSSQLAHEERWKQFVDRLYDDPTHEVALVRAALLKVALERRYAGEATLQDIAIELNDSWDRLVGSTESEPPVIGPVDFSPFDAAVAEVVALPGECTDPTDKFLEHLNLKIIPELASIASMVDTDEKLKALAARKKPWGTGSGGKAASWGGDVKAAKNCITAVNEARDAVVAAASNDVLRYLVTLVCEDVLAAADERRRNGGLEFHDLLVLAREMLRTSPDARQGLHDRYTHLLLDEFQDTDPLQIELAVLIATVGDRRRRRGSGRTCRSTAGRLFFVGDPKQSIYRFRRADIGLFLEARDRFGPGGACERLTVNFRTVAPVLDWVNAYFDAAMAEEEAGKQPRYEPLTAIARGVPGHRSPARAPGRTASRSQGQGRRVA